MSARTTVARSVTRTPAYNRDNERPFAGGPSTCCWILGRRKRARICIRATSDFSCILFCPDRQATEEMASYLDYERVYRSYGIKVILLRGGNIVLGDKLTAKLTKKNEEQGEREAKGINKGRQCTRRFDTFIRPPLTLPIDAEINTRRNSLSSSFTSVSRLRLSRISESSKARKRAFIFKNWRVEWHSAHELHSTRLRAHGARCFRVLSGALSRVHATRATSRFLKAVSTRDNNRIVSPFKKRIGKYDSSHFRPDRRNSQSLFLL